MYAESPRIRSWVTAARPVAHGMIAIPLLWGQAAALLVTQSFEWQWFVIIHVFGVLYQVYILYLNDYADESIDRLNQSYWMSGGSRVIPDGYLTGQQLYRASFLVLMAMSLLCVVGYALGRTWMPVPALLAIALGWAYSLPPVRASYLGYGELVQALGCGVALPVLAFYLQAGTLTDFPWQWLLPVGLVFFAGNIVTALPDVTSDSQGNKKTYPVRYGTHRARRDAVLQLLLAYMLIPVFCAPWLAWQTTSLVVSVPAVAVLFYVYFSGLVDNAEMSDRSACKRYIVLVTASQIWVMVLWSILLFGRGLKIA